MSRNRVCVLGYNRKQTTIIQAIEDRGFDADEISEKVENLADYDLVVSFGYRHIIGRELLQNLKRPAVNLHMAYLPFNRGAHPNFWSWMEETPSGVTIHEIDEGIDTGPIIFQKTVDHDAPITTFSQTYLKLFQEMETLFLANIESILLHDYVALPQVGIGTYHNARDLPEWMTSWDMAISDAKKLFKRNT